MTTTPRISVVIPAFNAAECIARTLDSVFSQTVAPLEVIVVDDGSTDSTCDVLGSFGEQIRVIQRENGGPGAARNTGARAAAGDWIALIDADDSWLPEKLERQLPHMKPDVGLVHAYVSGIVLSDKSAITFDRLWNQNDIGTSTVVVNKQVFESLGGFNEDRKLIGIEDYNLWLRLTHAGHRVVTVQEELTLYTPLEGSLSQIYAKQLQAELKNVELIGPACNVDETRVQSKRIALYDEYARALFWKRDLPAAREYFRELFRRRPSWNVAAHWLATFLPPTLLNLNRKTVSQNA